MKAIGQDRFGSADVLELREVADPEVGDDEVLIRVRAAGCGPDVWHIMAGKPNLVRAIPEVRRAVRAPRGRDVAGVLARVGSHVTDLVPGDEVFGVVEGSFAELAVAKPSKLARKPKELSFDEAAAVPISATTALQALRDVGEVQPGQRVLIIGAGGGVGTFAVQIAKAFGAHVTGVSSDSKTKLVRELGADDVIDYTREDFTDGSRTWDLIVDCAGRRPLHELRRALTPKGTLAIVGGDGGGNWTGGFFRQMLRAPLLSLFSGQRLRAVTAKDNHDDLVALTGLIEDGKLKPVVGRTFSLPEAADAIRYLEQGHATGKIVISVSSG
jgi:NADPH:quinone reductase-like Zn-dependent oxidoreductase